MSACSAKGTTRPTARWALVSYSLAVRAVHRPPPSHTPLRSLSPALSQTHIPSICIQLDMPAARSFCVPFLLSLVPLFPRSPSGSAGTQTPGRVCSWNWYVVLYVIAQSSLGCLGGLRLWHRMFHVRNRRGSCVPDDPDQLLPMSSTRQGKLPLRCALRTLQYTSCATHRARQSAPRGHLGHGHLQSTCSTGPATP